MGEMESEIEETINEFVFRAKSAPGGASARACAFFLDLVPVLAAAWILRRSFGLLAAAAGIAPAAWEGVLLDAIAVLLAFWGWEAVWCSSRFQATPGKMAHGLRVVTRDKGIRVDFARASRRAAFKMLPVLWIVVRAAALLLLLHLLGAATAFSPGAPAARWLYFALIALLSVVPSLPGWNSAAWRFNRQYGHDARASTLVRAPLRMPVRSVVLQIVEYVAVALVLLSALHRIVRDPPVPATFRLRREAEATVAKQFSRRFAKAPFRVAGVRLRVPEDAFGGSLGSILLATNFEGTVRISHRGGSTAELPVLANEGDDGLDGRLDESAGALRLLTGFLVECTAPEPPAAAAAGKAGPAPAPVEKPRPVRPGGSAATKDWLRVRFFGAETVPWPEDEPAKASPWLLVADFSVRNESAEPRFVADWEAACTVDGRPAKVIWLGSFDPLHAAIPPGGSCEGSILFSVPKPPASAKISWLGLEFETGPLDD